MNLSFLLSFWLAAAPDPWGSLARQILWVVQARGNDVTLEKPAQVIAARMEPELNRAPVNRLFHFWRAGERQAHVGAG